MSKFEIRKTQKGDSSAISSLLLQLWYDTAISKIEELASISSTDEICVGVMDGKVIVVMSVIFFNYFPSAEKVCRITSIVVDEDARGSGLGSKLIDHAKSLALTKKCNVLEVTTSLWREKAQAYYESIGS